MKQTAESTREPRPRPSHRVYQVTGQGKNAYWREIGAAWPNKDGRGFNISYHALPLRGRIVMRRIRDQAPPMGREAANDR